MYYSRAKISSAYMSKQGDESTVLYKIYKNYFKMQATRKTV